MDSKGVFWLILLHPMAHKQLPSFAQFLSQEQKDFWENILFTRMIQISILMTQPRIKGTQRTPLPLKRSVLLPIWLLLGLIFKKSSEMQGGGGGWLCYQGPQSCSHPWWGLPRQRELPETLRDGSRRLQGREVSHCFLGCRISAGILRNCTGLSHLRRWK